MPKPRQWATRRELISDLRDYDWHAWFSQAKGKILYDWSGIIRYSVGSNTFRAFHHLPIKPSEAFRTWADQALLQRDYFRLLLNVQSYSAYWEWLNLFATDFRNQWRTKT